MNRFDRQENFERIIYSLKWLLYSNDVSESIVQDIITDNAMFLTKEEKNKILLCISNASEERNLNPNWSNFYSKLELEEPSGNIDEEYAFLSEPIFYKLTLNYALFSGDVGDVCAFYDVHLALGEKEIKNPDLFLELIDMIEVALLNKKFLTEEGFVISLLYELKSTYAILYENKQISRKTLN